MEYHLKPFTEIWDPSDNGQHPQYEATDAKQQEPERPKFVLQLGGSSSPFFVNLRTKDNERYGIFQHGTPNEIDVVPKNAPSD